MTKFYEVAVDAVEEATIQYTAKVEASSREDAIRKVKAAIKEDDTAFLKYDCVETRVVDTIPKNMETVEWEEGQDPSWVARELSDKPPRICIVINDGSPSFVFSSQYKIGEFEAEVEVINFDIEGIEAQKKFWSVQQDDSMILVYARKESEE